jgi:hypothetical protein
MATGGEQFFMCFLSIWIFFFFKIFLFICSHVHTLFGPFLPSAPHPLSLPSIPTCFQAEPALPFSPVLLKRRNKQ